MNDLQAPACVCIHARHSTGPTLGMRDVPSGSPPANNVGRSGCCRSAQPRRPSIATPRKTVWKSACLHMGVSLLCKRLGSRHHTFLGLFHAPLVMPRPKLRLPRFFFCANANRGRKQPLPSFTRDPQGSALCLAGVAWVTSGAPPQGAPLVTRGNTSRSNHTGKLRRLARLR